MKKGFLGKGLGAFGNAPNPIFMPFSWNYAARQYISATIRFQTTKTLIPW